MGEGGGWVRHLNTLFDLGDENFNTMPQCCIYSLFWALYYIFNKLVILFNL